MIIDYLKMLLWVIEKFWDRFGIVYDTIYLLQDDRTNTKWSSGESKSIVNASSLLQGALHDIITPREFTPVTTINSYLQD